MTTSAALSSFPAVVELHEVRREAQSLEAVFMDLTGRGGVL